MGTSWVAVSINNIKTRATSEMTPRKNIKIFDFNGVNLPSTGMWRGEVFAISDCLVPYRLGIFRQKTLLLAFRVKSDLAVYFS